MLFFQPINSRRASGTLLLFSDVAGLVGAFNLAHWLRFGVTLPWLVGSWHLVWISLLTLAVLFVFNLYEPDFQISGLQAPARAFFAVGVTGAVFSALAYLGGPENIEGALGRGVSGPAFVGFAFWSTGWRYGVHAWGKKRERELNWLGVGEDECLVQFWQDFKTRRGPGALSLVSQGSKGFRQNGHGELPHPVGTWEDLDTLFREKWAGIVVGTQKNTLPDFLVTKLMHARLKGNPVYDLTEFYERFWYRVPIFQLKHGWFAMAHGFYLLHNPLGLRFKNLVERGLSVVLLVLLFPLMVLIALLIRLDSRGPVIFRQERTGEGGKIFRMHKFRTMRSDAEQNGPRWASEKDERTTRVGRVLRELRLDELPQIYDVFKGNMSFIGPRPERPLIDAELEKAIPFYDFRSLVKPGITGWAQVMFRYGASANDAREKLEFDLFYIKNYTPLLDFAIMLKTLRVVFLRAGR